MKATLEDLILAFKANIEQGCPCYMTYDGERVTLSPYPPGWRDDERFKKTIVGMVKISGEGLIKGHIVEKVGEVIIDTFYFGITKEKAK